LTSTPSGRVTAQTTVSAIWLSPAADEVPGLLEDLPLASSDGPG